MLNLFSEKEGQHKSNYGTSDKDVVRKAMEIINNKFLNPPSTSSDLPNTNEDWSRLVGRLASEIEYIRASIKL